MACRDAAELQARLAFRALFPARSELSGEQGESRGIPDVKVGARVSVSEEFMSDSGQSDKVLLEQGQRGVVMKLNETGKVCIDFEDHQKLQWVLQRNLYKLQVDDESSGSSLRNSVLEDLNSAMESSLRRRLARLENKFELLKQGSGGLAAASSAAPATEVAAAPVEATRRLETPLAKVLVKAFQTERPVKEYGPSETQEELPNPPEKDEEIVPESHTLQLTLECLEQNIQSRIRQSRSLQAQVATCHEMCRDMDDKVKAVCRREQWVTGDPSSARAVHLEEVSRRRQDVGELAKGLEKSRSQARRFEQLARQQHRYLRQNEHVSMMPRHGQILRHSAGEVALVLLPPPIEGDDGPATYDIGTAVANPYVVDSWPFEPNVLARRTFVQDPPMEPFKEETAIELENENRRLPKFVPNFHMPAGGFSDDDDDDRPIGTSRSM